jgi:hypothetical protein
MTTLWTGAAAATLLLYSYRQLRTTNPSAVIGAGTMAAGVWLFWSLLAFIQELDNANRPDNTSGMALVGLAGLTVVAGYLIYLGRQWRRLTQNEMAHEPGT